MQMREIMDLVEPTGMWEARYPRKPSSVALTKAAEVGYDTKLWYHGTRRRFDGFRLPKESGRDELGPGVYLTDEEWLANTWAHRGGFILTCVVRRGPLFDLATLDTPTAQAVLRDGYYQLQKEKWGQESAEAARGIFAEVWRDSRYKAPLANAFLAAAGYVGGFDKNSQISGQIVVFNPEDVLIVARKGGE